MLYSFYNVDNGQINLNDIQKKLVIIEDPPLKIYRQEKIIFIDFQMQSNIKSIILNHREKSYVFINAFERAKIDIVTNFFKNILNINFSPVHISTDSFKKMIKLDYQIVEMDATLHDPIIEDISISGTNIHEAELYNLIMNKGEIQKIVIYFDKLNIIKIGAVVKLFAEGKINIIPEFNEDTVSIIFNKILEGLEID